MNVNLLGRQRGFTLIEIMVALVISLFLVAGLIRNISQQPTSLSCSGWLGTYSGKWTIRNGFYY